MPTAALYIFSCLVYSLYCGASPTHSPLPGWKHAFQEHGVEGLCSLTMNIKSYTVLVLMSLINHLGQRDEPVISVVLAHLLKITLKCAQTGFAGNTHGHSGVKMERTQRIRIHKDRNGKTYLLASTTMRTISSKFRTLLSA